MTAAVLTEAQSRYLAENGLRRVTWRDRSLGHQIVILASAEQLVVSCNCLMRPGRGGNTFVPGRYEPIETRLRWEPGEAIAVWRRHLPADVPALDEAAAL